jgi:hypothetical protein
LKRVRELSSVVPLAPAHVVGAFACGDTDIDAFLHHRARAEQLAGFSQVYVTANAAREVVGYFTLSPITVRIEPELLSHLGVTSAPYAVIGGFLLGRLGVAITAQRRGIGEALVMRAAQLAKREAAVVGGAFLAVDPKTDSLVQWYARQEFVSLGAKTRRMILPLRAVPEGR